MTALPNFPPGDLRAVYLHWTAGDYGTPFPAYHFCIALDAAGAPVVRATHDLRANMRDVRAGDAPYAAHTGGRNSHAIGIAICAMAGARPENFGPYPLVERQLDAACRLAARLCGFYGIALERVRTHAEAACDDGYFGAGDDERWDIARLIAAAQPLAASEAHAVGDALRARVAAA